MSLLSQRSQSQYQLNVLSQPTRDRQAFGSMARLIAGKFVCLRYESWNVSVISVGVDDTGEHFVGVKIDSALKCVLSLIQIHSVSP